MVRIPGIPGVPGVPRILMEAGDREARREAEGDLSRGQRGRLRIAGWILLSVGFVLFLVGPVLFVLLAPPGADMAMVAVIVIIAFAILIVGGLLMAQGFAGSMARASEEEVDFSGSRASLLQRAQNLILAERLEDAAKIYDHLDMWKEAGELRRRARAQVVTHIEVDMNDLIDKMRNGGLTASYACPSCGGSIKISGATPTTSLTTCSFCGAALRMTDIAELLTRVTGIG